MKKSVLLFVAAFFIVATSCQKDDDPAVKINHVGEKWIITSVEYSIIDQNLSNPGQSMKTGTKTNAGAFYFNGGQGSFDITIDTYHIEDVFSYSGTTDISITSIDQNVGSGTFSQNVIAFSGEKDTDTTMEFDGNITKQSMTRQFVLTGTFTLVKE